jgi:GAF domain-containing protein
VGRVAFENLHPISLQTALFCVQCELISESNTPSCLVCGSQAVLSLSRILGGSLRGQQTAHLIQDAEMDRLVRELLSTVPRTLGSSEGESAHIPVPSCPGGRHHIRRAGLDGNRDGYFGGPEMEASPDELELEPMINVIAERAQALTGATGAAIALRRGNEIVCRARTGRTAPDLGVRLQTESGISAECVRTGEVVLCNDAERSLRIDLGSCRHLGVRSVLAAPLRHFRRTLGVFEVLSSRPDAFDHRDVATMELLSSMMVAAISRLSRLRPALNRRSA